MTRLLAVLVAATLGVPAPDPPIAELSEAWQAALAAGNYEEALKPSRRAIETLSEQHGDTASILVAPLQALGTAQRETGDYPGAEASFSRAIRILERDGGIFSRELYLPFMGLGQTYQAAGHYAEAATAFGRARHLVRRHDGLHDLGQIEALDALSENHFLQQEFDQAERYQLISLRLSERYHGAENPDLVPALLKLSRWYRRLDRAHPLHDLAAFEHRLNRRALNILETGTGADDPRLVPTLRAIASSYRERNINRRSGKQALLRALSLAEQSPDTGTATLANILIDLGDWNLQFGQPETGAGYYRRAWEILNADASLHALRDRRLSRPVPLHVPVFRPPEGFTRWRDEQPYVRVAVEFDVDEQGRVIDLRRNDIPPRLRRAAAVKLRGAVFRPAVDGGEPRRTNNVTLDLWLP